jgi:hypothetical protein
MTIGNNTTRMMTAANFAVCILASVVPAGSQTNAPENAAGVGAIRTSNTIRNASESGNNPMTTSAENDVNKHTPGPWVVRTERLDGHPNSDWTEEGLIVESYREPICRLYEHMGTCFDNFENDEANARLIAAAPELYELAKAVAEHFDGTDALLGKWAAELVEKVKP